VHSPQRKHPATQLACMLFVLCSHQLASAQNSKTGLSDSATTGPVIVDHGPVFDLPDSAFQLNKDQTHKVLFDVAGGKRDRGALNRRLESVARFLNMHARSGVDPDKLKLAVVMHGGSSFDALSDVAYRKRFGMDNPNSELLAALHEAGVELWLCGQSAGFNQIKTDDLSSHVGLALSAMTVMVELDSQGYVLLR